jgi:hypothetical protein
MGARGQAVLLIFAVLAKASIVDRIAVVVDRTPIKESDIRREIRLTAFINGEQPNFELPERKKAASRLIDQAVLRKEIGMGRYAEPTPEQVQQLSQQIRSRYKTEPSVQAALKAYGITQQELMDHLRWQETVLQFIAIRFGSVNAPANNPKNGVTTIQADPNQPFFNWLDETRKQTHVVFKEEDLKENPE